MSDDLTLYSVTKASGGESILHVLTKRTYRVLPTGYCRPAQAQIPLSFDPVDYDRLGQGGASPPKAESDALCNRKPGTDVVVQGRAYALQRPVASMDVVVAVTTPSMGESEAWRNARRVRIFGDRRASLSPEGRIRFGAPEPFQAMDISYDRAYGGRDLWAEQKHPDELGEFMKDHSQPGTPLQSAYSYLRNPAGHGYLVYKDAEAISEVHLPNVEDPLDLLTPDRLCLSDTLRWHQAPIPAGFDWIDPSWFPRFGFLGVVPDFDGRPEDLPEVKRGHFPVAIAQRSDGEVLPQPPPQEISDRFCHGASPGLGLPAMKGGESILIGGMHSTQAVLHVHVPTERPRVFMEPPLGTKIELSPTLRTVLLDIEGSQLVVVWGAQLAMDRPLTDTQKERVRYGVQWL